MADLMKQYKRLKSILGDSRDLKLTDEDTLGYQDILFLLEGRGYILDIKIDGMNWYRKVVEWDGFEEWLRDEIKESKRISRREWLIGIVCAIIGATIGLIPTIISLFTNTPPAG